MTWTPLNGAAVPDIAPLDIRHHAIYAAQRSSILVRRRRCIRRDSAVVLADVLRRESSIVGGAVPKKEPGRDELWGKQAPSAASTGYCALSRHSTMQLDRPLTAGILSWPSKLDPSKEALCGFSVP